MLQRVYIDTSVIGGCFDNEFEEWSNKLTQAFLSGSKIAVISDLTIDEVNAGPEEVKERMNAIIENNSELVTSDEETYKLASTYISEGALSENFFEDAQHIAVATVLQVDVLVSWNFKHIVNLNKIRLYNSVNLKNGYPFLEIRTPREILEED